MKHQQIKCLVLNTLTHYLNYMVLIRIMRSQIRLPEHNESMLLFSLRVVTERK